MLTSFLAAIVATVPAAGPVSKYVDPMIGTSATGHTFPAAVLPHGMVQLGPDTGFSGWDHASGYRNDDGVIHGFSHMHLSGTGGSDFGDVLVAPTVGDVQLGLGDPNKPGTGYSSKFEKKDEVARAGYYAVFLQNPQVEVQLTTTPRVGIHRYTFPATDKANLTFDITSQIGGQERTFSSARWISPPVMVYPPTISSLWEKQKRPVPYPYSTLTPPSTPGKTSRS
ncbi:hypothetical protein EON80_24115 [bacterium]|nr:MAG: hypothetical protein EON80_24115 [bacterium]